MPSSKFQTAFEQAASKYKAIADSKKIIIRPEVIAALQNSLSNGALGSKLSVLDGLPASVAGKTAVFFSGDSLVSSEEGYDSLDNNRIASKFVEDNPSEFYLFENTPAGQKLYRGNFIGALNHQVFTDVRRSLAGGTTNMKGLTGAEKDFIKDVAVSTADRVVGTNMAAQAQGDVRAFVQPGESNSVWFQNELPQLVNRNAGGSIQGVSELGGSIADVNAAIGRSSQTAILQNVKFYPRRVGEPASWTFGPEFKGLIVEGKPVVSPAVLERLIGDMGKTGKKPGPLSNHPTLALDPEFAKPFIEGRDKAASLPDIPGFLIHGFPIAQEKFDPAPRLGDPPPSTAAKPLPDIPPSTIFDRPVQPLARLIPSLSDLGGLTGSTFNQNRLYAATHFNDTAAAVQPSNGAPSSAAANAVGASAFAFLKMFAASPEGDETFAAGMRLSRPGFLEDGKAKLDSIRDHAFASSAVTDTGSARDDWIDPMPGLVPTGDMGAGLRFLGRGATWLAADTAGSAVDVLKLGRNLAAGSYGNLFLDPDARARAAPDFINAALWATLVGGLLERPAFGMGRAMVSTIGRPMRGPALTIGSRAATGSALGAALFSPMTYASASEGTSSGKQADPMCVLQAEMYRPEAVSSRPFEADDPPRKLLEGSPQDASADLVNATDRSSTLSGPSTIGRGVMSGEEQLFAPSRLSLSSSGFTGRSVESVPSIQTGFTTGAASRDQTLKSSTVGKPALDGPTLGRGVGGGIPVRDVGGILHAHPWFGLRGPIAPNELLISPSSQPAHQRDAERAVLPAARPAAAEPRTLSGTVDFDHGPLLAAIDHVDTLQRKLQGLRAVASVEINHNHRHSHQGDGGATPGALRTALNGNFGSDGRAWG